MAQVIKKDITVMQRRTQNLEAVIADAEMDDAERYQRIEKTERMEKLHNDLQPKR